MEEVKESHQKRWIHLKKVLERPGPFTHPEFEPSPDILDFILSTCKILIIGAGGLGCELLKDLAMMGFKHIDIIDMDIIDLSNLNRQFLFRHKDIGVSKAQVAANYINARIAGCQVTPHCCPIEDKKEDFYRGFHIIVCGLDSITARRWINGMVVSLLNYDDNGVLDQSSIIPLVDGGTEGFKGNARVILPGMTACVECTLDLYPPQVTYPLCTIANTPRLPEHCVEYVKVVQWPKENPFGVALDGDDAQHTTWIYEKALERANQFNIHGVTFRLVQGVVKNIIPAVASTNAVISAVCATEVFKLATSCCTPLNNFMVFNDIDGIYTYAYEAEKKDNCTVCSNIPHPVDIDDPCKMKLKDLIDFLCENIKFQMKNPGLTTTIDGKSKTLYIPTIKMIEERTRPNLSKTLIDLGLRDGQEIVVADVTTPTSVIIKLRYTISDVEIN
ncbi:NEDD8-activating enzyme E1 catalytic subunit [Sitophilus oryzae]|uniref:NEDD8-activating enzyme E1 catalytic subunit n=1 Tax=Sitophilus oryzae TaxID=7048 RepID=A0A6J2XWV9_SITOR|nr:NEDD8-activating enzyme E1 catalytic subunit [Sitophilus oryzae]